MLIKRFSASNNYNLVNVVVMFLVEHYDFFGT